MISSQKVAEEAVALTMLYYNSFCEEIKYDAANADVITTANTIDYMLDSGIAYSNVVKELQKHNSAKITIADLSDTLWKGSLIKRGAFYLHRELRMISPAPVYSLKNDMLISYPYYCEMKILYTEKDVLEYFRRNLNPLSRSLQDDRLDLPYLRKMLGRYSKVDFVEALDIVLCLIDYNIKQNEKIYKIYEVFNNEQEVIEQLSREMQELEAQDLRKVVPRRKCMI